MKKTIRKEPLTRVRSYRWGGWLVIASFFVGAMLAHSQARAAVLADEGRISGVVQDESTALIPGTRITVVNSTTGDAKETRTNGEGNYTVSNLAAGTYIVTAE